jgi:hypothetical protein
LKANVILFEAVVKLYIFHDLLDAWVGGTKLVMQLSGCQRGGGALHISESQGCTLKARERLAWARVDVDVHVLLFEVFGNVGDIVARLAEVAARHDVACDCLA